MMAFDFPSSPTTGQTYSVTGGPTYVYNGTAWVVLTPGNQFNRTVFTATAGQTTFTMNYVVGAIDVYRNGVKLAPAGAASTADFTATNGTSIVLANGCTVGDTVEVISYPMITYSDAVKRTGDTLSGDLILTTGQTVNTLVPAGAVMTFARNSAPDGWVKANGAALSRSVYSALFDAIGTTFGVGNGSTTFNVPDLRGEFIRGWDDGRAVDTGRTFGSFQADDFKSHNHPVNGRYISVGNPDSAGFTTIVDLNPGFKPNTDSTGGTETRPRNIALLACIKF
jgi:microcystin-dependent protein